MKSNLRLIWRAAARIVSCLPALAFYLAGEPLAAQTNLVVAPDGSGRFKTVQEAIMAVPSGSRENPVVIHIKPGIYKELIYIQREKCFFKLVGENPTNTILTFNLYAGITNAEGKPIGTFKTPSTTIDADDFTAENLTFENSAGPVGQALAIRVDGDRATFRNCRFLGWQDTILLNRGRQYFENCYICGHVDFIFGAATAWFEKCEIHSLRDGLSDRRLDAGGPALRFCLLELQNHRRAGRENLSRPSVADLRQHHLSELRNVRGRPAREAGMTGESRRRTRRRATRNSTAPAPARVRPTGRIGRNN